MTTTTRETRTMTATNSYGSAARSATCSIESGYRMFRDGCGKYWRAFGQAAMAAKTGTDVSITAQFADVDRRYGYDGDIVRPRFA